MVGEEKRGSEFCWLLGVVPSDCHGKMMFRAERQCNDIQSQGTVGADACAFCSDFRGSREREAHRETTHMVKQVRECHA